MKLTEQRLTISLSKEQYDFVKKFAEEKYEGRFSQAIRTIIQVYMNYKVRKG